MSSIRYSIRPNAISAKDQQFADHFFGGPDRLRGSAKACYKNLHPRCQDSTAATEGPALLRKPQVQAYLEQQGKKITERAEINAQWVLEQSIRLYKRCMGDELYPVEYERTDPETGIVTAETYATRSFNAAGARAALELIGRHCAVQAFQVNVEVSHTHYLEQALARRAKAVEDRATRSITVLPGANDVQPGRGPPASEPGHAPGRERQAGPISLNQVDLGMPIRPPAARWKAKRGSIDRRSAECENP